MDLYRTQSFSFALNEAYDAKRIIGDDNGILEYVALKMQLKEQYEHNRDAYTNLKEEFISKYSKLAKIQYGDRYQMNAVSL